MNQTIGYALLFIGLCSITGGRCFEWTSTGHGWLPDNVTETYCAQSEAVFPWTYRCAAGESVLNVEWRYKAHGSTEVVLATLVNGHFFGDSAQGPALEYMGSDARVRLPSVQVTDNGTYSVLVNLRRTAGFVSTYSKRVHVNVIDNSFFANSSLQGRVEGVKVINFTFTPGPHLVLTCDLLVNSTVWSLPVNVVWTTPWNHSVPSTYVRNIDTNSSSDNNNNTYPVYHSYSLALPNPIQDGRYTCRIDNSSSGSCLLRGDSPLLTGASVEVDGVKWRMAVMESEVEGLGHAVQGQKEVIGQLTNLVVALQRSHSVLTSYVLQLTGNVSQLQETVADLRDRNCCNNNSNDSGRDKRPGDHGDTILGGTCNFEESLCAYSQSQDDDFDWDWHSGPSSKRWRGTGPASDHTTGTDKGHYMVTPYVGTSWSSGRKSVLQTSFNDPSPQGICVAFYYHMLGANMGTLNLKVRNQTSDGVVLYSRSGSYGDKWLLATVNVPGQYLSVPYQIQFESINGPGYLTEMAIDDVTVTSGPCA